jgi:mannose-6-phosphate isomerase-like protein (cupin superfamily)
MTVFRSSDRAPEWCQLERFEIVDLGRDETRIGRTATPSERLIVTQGTCQLRLRDRSLLLKEAQFYDIDAGAGDWTIAGAAQMAQFVRLAGHWANDLGGCGIFRVRRTDAPNSGDPVAYPKHTNVDRHYHDCDEFWILLEGRGTVVVDETSWQVGPGDCLAIGMGHPHDFPVIESEVKAVFFETTLEGKKRTGHLWNHTHGIAQPRLERV